MSSRGPALLGERAGFEVPPPRAAAAAPSPPPRLSSFAHPAPSARDGAARDLWGPGAAGLTLRCSCAGRRDAWTPTDREGGSIGTGGLGAARMRLAARCSSPPRRGERLGSAGLVRRWLPRGQGRFPVQRAKLPPPRLRVPVRHASRPPSRRRRLATPPPPLPACINVPAPCATSKARLTAAMPPCRRRRLPSGPISATRCARTGRSGYSLPAPWPFHLPSSSPPPAAVLFFVFFPQVFFVLPWRPRFIRRRGGRAVEPPSRAPCEAP